VHAPDEQATVALARGAQAIPQPPQCESELASGASQPSAATPLQSPKPAAQVNVQASPAPQRGAVALTGVGHGSMRVARPSALQTVRAVAPAGHVAMLGVQTQPVQVVPEHVDEAGQGSVV